MLKPGNTGGSPCIFLKTEAFGYRLFWRRRKLFYLISGYNDLNNAKNSLLTLQDHMAHEALRQR